MLSSYGATITSVIIPNEEGEFDDVVLGFDTRDEYEKGPACGSIVGRCSNRIKDGNFQIDGKLV